MHALRPLGRFVRASLKPLAYALAFVLPTILTVVVLFTRVISQGTLGPPPALDRPLPDRLAHDPARPTAVVVAGNMTTEVSDLLAPYEVLAASNAFNVYIVAPERRLTPLGPGQVQHCCAFLDVMPHYSFAEYDQTIGTAPDLIVVPYIPRADAEDAAVLSWLRGRPDDRTVILSICAGARMVADAGILAGHTATTQQTIMLPLVRMTHPEVDWVEGVHCVDDGRFISSAGVTSGIDATLYTVSRFLGRETAPG